MRILDLHDLANIVLHDLAVARWMSNGWNPEASRRVDRKSYQLRATLETVLKTTPTRLLDFPSNSRMKVLLATAAEEHKLVDMVTKMVTLLESEPEVDQEDAAAASDMSDQISMARRLSSTLSEFHRKLEKESDDVGALALTELAATLDSLKRLIREVDSKQNTLEDNKSALGF